MEIAELRRNWEAWGRLDPMWAVLTDPDKRGGRWDPEEFFASGRVEVDHVLSLARPSKWNRALDFGCGVGRASQALARHFKGVVGVDLAESMVKQAQMLNQMGRRCEFRTYDGETLPFPNGIFNLVYSLHVLQHIAPHYQRQAIAELVRVTRPGGLLVLQTVSDPVLYAMPDEAYQAEITVPVDRLTINGHAVLTVAVRNGSAHRWTTEARDFTLNLGNHWARDGRCVVTDDGRTHLPPLAPGEQVTVELKVTAPDEPGEYELELDVVHEGTAWFGDKGSSVAKLACTVEQRHGGEPDPVEAASIDNNHPVMEMHGVRVDEMACWASEAGGSVRHVLDFDEAFQRPPAGDWRRHIFVIERPGRPTVGSRIISLPKRLQRH